MKKAVQKMISLLIICLLLVAVTLSLTIQNLQPDGSTLETETVLTSGLITETASRSVVNLSGASYRIAIDVNPSIELVVVDGIVEDVVAYNDDGEKLLYETSFADLTADQAVRAVIARLIADNYISDSEIKPYLIVTVTHSDEPVGEAAVEALEKAAQEALSGQAFDCAVRTAYIPDDVAKQAAEYDLSAGRYIIMKYIADTLESSIENVMTEYGDLKIGELMVLFDGAKDAFKAYNRLAEGEEEESADDLEGMTPEQQELFQAALAVFHAEVRAANDAFQSTFAGIKAETKLQIAAARTDYRRVDRALYRTVMADLRESLLSARRTAITEMKAAISSAKTNFKTAIAALGLPDEAVDEELDDNVDSLVDTDDELDELLVSLNEEPAETVTDDSAGKPAGQDKPEHQNGKGSGKGNKPIKGS